MTKEQYKSASGILDSIQYVDSRLYDLRQAHAYVFEAMEKGQKNLTIGLYLPKYIDPVKAEVRLETLLAFLDNEVEACIKTKRKLEADFEEL